jgi:hypothetical protein
MIASKEARPAVRMMRPPPGVRAVIGLAAVMATLLLTSSVARAQDAGIASPQGSRWWFGGGGGYLAGRADCTNCESDPPFGNGSAFLFHGGLRLTERLLVGGEIFTTGRTMNGTDLRDTYLLGLVQFRPFATHGFFLKGGYGVAFVKDAFTVEGVQETARTSGIGLMYGVGWVFRESSRVSFAPVAAQYVTTVGDVQAAAGTAQNVVVNSWFVGAVVMVR